MTFDYDGYPLGFITKQPCKDETEHLFTLIYKFYSPETSYIYIVRAEYHAEDVFVIKFYCKKHRSSEFKYSTIINKGDLGNILITVAKVIPLLLNEFPTASFGFIGARTVDKKSKSVESFEENQRFVVYKEIVKAKFGNQTFLHLEYPLISAYLLLNRIGTSELKSKEEQIKNMFIRTYPNIPA